MITYGAAGRPARKVQFDKIQDLIQSGVAEGATLVTGGPGRPADLNRGYYVRPTVFANVTPEMRIAREEIFGPVLSIMPYDTVEEAIERANDTVYGLASYIQAKDNRKGAPGLPADALGQRIHQLPRLCPGLPFGGYK